MFYGEYDISCLPDEALPDLERVNNGRHSYTLGKVGSSVEILLQKEAYFVKKINADGSGPLGQVSWAKHGGPVEAFAVAKARSGYRRW